MERIQSIFAKKDFKSILRESLIETIDELKEDFTGELTAKGMDIMFKTLLKNPEFMDMALQKVMNHVEKIEVIIK